MNLSYISIPYTLKARLIKLGKDTGIGYKQHLVQAVTNYLDAFENFDSAHCEHWKKKDKVIVKFRNNHAWFECTVVDISKDKSLIKLEILRRDVGNYNFCLETSFKWLEIKDLDIRRIEE